MEEEELMYVVASSTVTLKDHSYMKTLTGEIQLKFLENELPDYLEYLLLDSSLNMCFQQECKCKLASNFPLQKDCFACSNRIARTIRLLLQEFYKIEFTVRLSLTAALTNTCCDECRTFFVKMKMKAALMQIDITLFRITSFYTSEWQVLR